MITAPPAPPDTLSPLEADALLHLIEAEGSVIDAARQYGMSADHLLVLLERPAARSALHALRLFNAARREVRSEADRHELVQILRNIARLTPDLVERRRAATTALRALDRSVPRSAGPRRSVPRPSSGFDDDGRETVPHAPSMTRPSPGVDDDGRAITPHEPRRVADAAPPLDHAAPGASGDPDNDLDQALDRETDDELDRELDENPERDLALARHVLDAVQQDPTAYPDYAVRAAHTLLQIERDHPRQPRAP